MGKMKETDPINVHPTPESLEVAAEVQRVRKILAYGKRQHDEMGEVVVDTVTCGSCGRSWNDAIITSLTPAPSGRCPFEYAHESNYE